MEETGKYEWDGPKTQYDADQLIEFYEKLLNDHPLVRLIEDCFAQKDIQGYKKLIAKLKEADRVTVSVKEMFKSDIETIRDYTVLIQEESDEEDDKSAQEDAGSQRGSQPGSARGSQGDASVEKVPPIAEVKETKKGDKKGQKGSPKNSARDSDAEAKLAEAEDINYNKFIPGAIHIDRTIISSVSPLLALFQMCQTMKKDESSSLVIEDNTFDNLSADLVDFAFGSGAVSYLSISGMGKPEKSAKAARFQQILCALNSMMDREQPVPNDSK